VIGAPKTIQVHGKSRFVGGLNMIQKLGGNDVTSLFQPLTLFNLIERNAIDPPFRAII